MSTRSRMETRNLLWLPILLLSWPALSSAQVPVDSDGKPIGDYSEASENSAMGNEDIPLLSAAELEELVGPIALYPDDLLAIVLPASAYPLQIVQAGRFLEELENDPSLKPDESWDDSVVALTNYPEVIKLLNDDLDWTWRLGEAVVAQQADVIAAVETFRDRAYAAGNLKSDEHQTISQDEGYIEITPVDDDVIYVPYYEPERVVVYQPRPVYYYYPRPYPVYYYPYPSGYAFHSGFFWGVTTAFSLGWHTNSLHVYHHSYYGHPYYGHYYWPRWWYRQPSISVYNTVYVHDHLRRSRNYYRSGDYWQPRARRTVRMSDNRITRTRYYPSGSAQTRQSSDSVTRSSHRSRSGSNHFARQETRRESARPEIRFRERSQTTPRSRSDNRADREERVLPARNRVTPDRNRERTERNRVTAERNRVTAERNLRDNAPRAIERESFKRPNVRRDTSRREPRETRRSSSPQSLARHSEPRQNHEPRLRSSEPRRSQPQVRRSEPRQSQPQVRRSEPRQSQPQVRRSESRRSQSRQPKGESNSDSRKLASVSNRDDSRGSRRRR